MRVLLAASLLIAAAASAAPPPPPPPPPLLQFQGRDQVLIGRVYWREGGATQPLARFGTILSGGSSSVPVAVAGPAGNLTLSLGARRKGEHEAVVTWTLQPGAGAAVGAAEGRALVSEGSIGHLALGSGQGGELFASLETGRASTFNLQRLWDHFGVVTTPQPAPPPAAPWIPPSAAAAAPAPPAQRGGTLTVTCPIGSRFELATGTGRGSCEVAVDGDRVSGGRCDDGDGNWAAATCGVNDGRGTCTGTGGAGSCRQAT